MGFRQRWALVALATVTFLVIFFGFNPGELKCRCHTKCRQLGYAKHPCEPNKHPCEPNKHSKNKFKHSVPQEDNPIPDLRLDGWIVDCITWDKKWELDELETDPHEFVVDDKFRTGETASRRSQLFGDIYEQKTWEGSDKDSHYNGIQASGPGAWLRNAQGVVASLHMIVNQIKDQLGQTAVTILDLGCGDMQWMSRFLVTREDVHYTGVDIVPVLVTSHMKQFDTLPYADFISDDIVTMALNQSYDIVICRDVFHYLVQSDVLTTIMHISSSGSKYLLATNFPDTTKNSDNPDVGTERSFPYNLELPPFLLEPPICTSYDWNVEHLALWALPVRQKYEY
jgi:SAM-dependent methyltransferase